MEEARIKKEVETLFKLSQQAYGRGVYDKSVEMLEDALTKVPGGTNLGGEVRLRSKKMLIKGHCNPVKGLVRKFIIFTYNSRQ